ncbi:hypothetical protein [Endothiovibrio diazotrophicus]
MNYRTIGVAVSALLLTTSAMSTYAVDANSVLSGLFSFNTGGTTSGTGVAYDATARLSPQVIAGGISPSKIDLADTEFDIVAIIRPGILPLGTVSFRSSTGTFSLAMQAAGVLPNGDEIYKSTFTFSRGAFGTTTMATTWGDSSGQYNVQAVDSGQQRTHRFPELIVGNYPEQTASTSSPSTVSYNSTKRFAPQVVMAGYSPALLDIADEHFDVIAIVRDGVLPISQVSVSQNQGGGFSALMQEAGHLDNGDKVYTMTYTFPRGSLGSNTTISTVWGDEPGQFKIQAVDEGQQHTHAFPDIEFGNYPEI